MPITVKAVTPADYEKWLAAAKAEYAEGPVTVKVADANMTKVLENEAAN
jgi:heme/copper-type cytochrome/quinol oxidase subunit 2